MFAAINCWQPDSTCRANHKVSSFPALILHVNTGAKKGTKKTFLDFLIALQPEVLLFVNVILRIVCTSYSVINLIGSGGRLDAPFIHLLV